MAGPDRFVQARYYTPRARDPREVYAEAHHMAEGFGTVNWLTHPTNNVSATLVIEASGRVTQMVKATDMDHSLHVRFDSDSNDASNCGIYSLDLVEAILRPAGVGDLRNFEAVLPYLVSIEWEGFRADGPTAVQVAAYLTKVKPWLLTTFPNLRGRTGHRGFQDYKSCPGCKFPWAQIGGHGLYKPTEARSTVNTTIQILPWGGRYTIPAGKKVIGFKLDGPGGDTGSTKTWEPRATPSTASYDAVMVTDATSGNPFIRAIDGFFAGFYISAGLVVEAPNPAPTPTGDLAGAHDEGAREALAHIAGPYAALGDAIDEAQPR